MTSTATATADRFVRVCPTHRRPLIEGAFGKLSCPAGETVERWLTVDREKAMVISESDEERGELSMLRERVRTTAAAAPARRPRKEAMPMRTTLPDAAPAKPLGRPTKGVLEKVKFEHREKALWIRLRRGAWKGQEPFRVEWTLFQSREKGAKRTQGVQQTATDEEAAREKYEVALQAARKLGWTDVPLSMGTKLVLTPIPAPKRAWTRRRGKK